MRRSAAGSAASGPGITFLGPVRQIHAGLLDVGYAELGPPITLEGDANGAPHPEPSSYRSKFSGAHEHRLVGRGVGHNLPQEAPREFAQAILDVGGGP
jgi:hypothetical protein